ncbi:MAG: hypothetical protein ABJE95_02040 [Byssovorax sp.]
MPSYEDFGSNVEAHLRYAGHRPLAEAWEILRRRLGDGTWKEAPQAWMNRLHHRWPEPGVESETAEELRAGLIEQVLRLDLVSSERVVHEALPALFALWLKPMLFSADIGRLVAWFLKQARPGHASLAADVLSAAYDREAYQSKDVGAAEGWIRPLVHPLAEWLTLNGAAELRSRRRHDLALDVVHAFHLQRAGLEQLVPCIRYVLLNEQSLTAFFNPARDKHARLLQAVEHAVGAGASESLAVDVVLAWSGEHRDSALTLILHPRVDGGEYPHLRGALIRALARGRFTGSMCSTGWRAAFWCPFPVARLMFTTVDALEGALTALSEENMSYVFPHLSEARVPVERIQPWANFVASEAMRILGLPGAIKSHGQKPVRLDQFAHRSDAAGILRGIRDAAYAAIVGADAPAPLVLARAILEEGSEDPMALGTAFLAIPVAPPLAVVAAREELLDRLQHHLFNLINQPWLEPAFGISLPKLIGHATRLELADLADENLVEIVGGLIRVDRRALAGAINLSGTEEERLAHGSLYFFHELIHHPQGINRKVMVDPLHAAGAESTLLHIDLGADHASACLVSQAMPRWSLSWLKDLQGRSLVNFPAGRFHTAAARARKAQRLVGLRLDFLARTVTPSCDVGADQYVFADFGPAGGPFLILRSGPPFALMGASDLSRQDAAHLSGAADAGRGERELRELDEILRRLLESRRRP